VRYEDFLRAVAFTLAPAVRFDRAGLTLQARGAFSHFEGGSRSVQGIGAVSLVSPVRWGLRGEFYGELGTTRYERAATREALTANNILAAGRVHAGGPRTGVWVGAGVGVVSPNFRFPDDLAQVNAGAWRRAGDVILSVEVAPSRVANADFTDASVGARWVRPQGEVGVSGGWRAGDVSAIDRWVEFNGTVWVARNLALVGGFGQYPAEALRGLPGGRYVAAAVRVASRAPSLNDPVRRAELTLPYELQLLRRAAPSARSFQVEPDASGARTLRVVVRGARRVELMADFTDWTAIALEPAGPNSWSTTVFIAPGVHRVNLRVDGGPWTVPPGLNAVVDDFGGTVGLLVVH
jgi:hypothetical protein